MREKAKGGQEIDGDGFIYFSSITWGRTSQIHIDDPLSPFLKNEPALTGSDFRQPNEPMIDSNKEVQCTCTSTLYV